MPGTFAYTESTNKIVVTAGTSGAPATFNDMYVADQAGTATDLLLAEAGTSGPGNPLTYAIRPTHDKALVIKCIVAGKTAEADFIFITGTDAWGATQTESLDVTAGNGTYMTTKRFATATEFDCSDNAAGGGIQWADGTIQVTQDIWGVVWEYVTDGQYKVDCNVNFGDASTATYFQSKNELVYFTDEKLPLVTAQAILERGDLVGSYGTEGSAWSIALPDSNKTIMIGANAKLYDYGSMWIRRDSYSVEMRFYTGEWIARNMILSGDKSKNEVSIKSGNINWDRVWLLGIRYLGIDPTPVAFTDTHMHNTSLGITGGLSNPIIVKKLKQTTTSGVFILNYKASPDTFTVQDPEFTLSAAQIVNVFATGIVIEQYTCNIHITDKEGNNLSGVTVKCVEAGGTTEFSASTDANGNIAEQTVDYKKWEGTSETLTDYSPHEFTFTKAGYLTQKIVNQTVNHPLVWEIKMYRSPYARILGVE